MNVIRRAWQLLFPPRAVTEVKQHISALFNRHASICRPYLERCVAREANHAEFLVYAIEVKGSSPQTLALLIVRNALEEQLGSGQHHIYRGTLSEIGTDMLETLHGIIAEMKSAGEMADVNKDDYFQFIGEQIKLAG